MRTKTLLISSLLITCILTGCNGKSATTTIETETTTEIESTTEVESTTTEPVSTTEIESTTSETETSTTEIESTTDSAEAGALTYTITDMDKIMYATKNCNVRKGPDADTFEKIGALNKNEEVHVTGKVNEVNWYRISLADGSEAYVSGTLLSDTKQAAPATTPKPSAGNGNSQTQQPAADDTQGYINPATGEPLKPGESYTLPTGETIVGLDWSEFY